MAPSQHPKRSSSIGSSTSGRGSSTSQGSSTLFMRFLRRDPCIVAMGASETSPNGVEPDPVVFSDHCGSPPSAAGPSSPQNSDSSVRRSGASATGSTNLTSTKTLSSDSSHGGSTAMYRAHSPSKLSTGADSSGPITRPPYIARTVAPASSHYCQANDYSYSVKSARRPVILTAPTRPRRFSSSLRFQEPSCTTGISGHIYRTTQVSPVRGTPNSFSIRLWPVLAPRRHR